MVILLNGAFGIGKTTTARALERAVPNAILFDPERIGYILQRMPPWLLGGARRTQDFQDIPLWRSLTVLGIRVTRIVWSTVIVPMTFSNLAYLDEVRRGIGEFEPNIRHFCLVAPVEVVQERLRQREPGGQIDLWLHRRIFECCEVQQRPEFEEHIPTINRSIEVIVSDLVVRLKTGQQSSESAP